MHLLGRALSLAASALMIAGAVVSANAHGLEVEAGWTPGTPAGASNQAAYLTIVNEAFHPEFLYMASTPVAARIELHRTATGSGMVRVKRLEIPLDGRLDMKKAGYHLMLMGMKRTLEPGEIIPVTLNFGDGRIQKSSISVAAPSVAAPGAVPAGGGHRQAHP